LFSLSSNAQFSAGSTGRLPKSMRAIAAAGVLLHVLQETRRAGEHLISADALQLLQWELHGAALAVLQQLSNSTHSSSSFSQPGTAGAADGTNSSNNTVSEKGVLQLLFDQRLLRDVLGSSKPPGADAGSVAAAASAANGMAGAGGAAALAARKRLVMDVEQQLQVGGWRAGSLLVLWGCNIFCTLTRQRQLLVLLCVLDAASCVARCILSMSYQSQLSNRLHLHVCACLQDQLDPIDWATYEPHLWSNVQRYHQRTSVLLGMLGQLHKPYADAPRPAAAAASSDLNALNVLPVAARFHYLPISTPTAMHAGAAVAKQRALSMGHSGVGLPGFAGSASEAAAGAVLAAAANDGSSTSQASDLAAQHVLSELGSGSSGMSRASPGLAARGGTDAAAAGVAGSAQAMSQQLHMSADAAAAAGASALSALQARLQGSGFGAFGSLLGDRAAGAAAEVSAMAQNFGDLLPSAGLGGGLLSSFSRRDGTAGSGTGQATTPGSKR
jgi:hypothetical protein